MATLRHEDGPVTANRPATKAVIFARNEAGNIGPLVQALLAQGGAGALGELVVVVDDATDGTAGLARSAGQGDSRLRVQENPVARGKWPAMYAFFESCPGGPNTPWFVFSADVLPGENLLSLLLAQLTPGGEMAEVVGSRVVPLNELAGFGRVVHVLWALHHAAALARPRAGEMLLLKNLPPPWPRRVLVDEPALCELARQRGGRVVYAPQAVVFNLGPGRVGEYLRRRRALAAGFVVLRQEGLCPRYRFHEWWPMAKCLLRWTVAGTPVGRWPVLAACGLEVFSRLLGWWDAATGNLSPLWSAAPSTKTLPSEAAAREAALKVQSGFWFP